MVHIGNVWQLLTIKDPLKDRVRNKVAHGRKQAPKALQYIARPTHREFLEELAICARSLKK